MLSRLIQAVLLLGLAAGCASQSSVKPVEAIDERTGVTLGALKKPIELVPGAQNAVVTRKRATFAYLGPVEWNRSGNLTYGLWIHIAPGNDHQLGDIHGSAAPTLVLDDGSVTLTPTTAPSLGRSAYKPVVSWGQTAYFDLTVETLRRMAASRKLELDIGAVDGSSMVFFPTVDTHEVLTQYLQDRGLTGD
jgi:hypothetical protein